MLWLAIHLPQLALQALPLAESPQPLAVIDLLQGRRLLLAVNRPAQQAGLKPEMNLALALGICPALSWHLRQPETEVRVLQQTALWAMAFTPTVSIEAEQGLLLEIAGCLNYFGGLPSLLQQVEHGLLQLGFDACLAVAPTAAAAMLLAQSGHNGCWMTQAELLPVLDVLSVAHLPAAGTLQSWLQGLGVRTLGACRRLPRKGLARRIGPAFLLLLDQLYGEAPDPRAVVAPPLCFSQSLTLPYPVTQAEALLFAGRRLCEAAAGFLAGHGAGARLLRWSLMARDGAPQLLDVGLLAPSRSAEQFIALLREHLQHTSLQAPIEVLQLEICEHEPLAGEDLSLWQQGGASAKGAAALPQLLSRLQARLGESAVQRLNCADEHRPELAWRGTPVRSAGAGEGARAVRQLRPAWLLATPQLLSLVDGVPWYQGPLLLSASPERIESGWWDDLPVRRDYFLARSRADGSCYWVFQEHGSGLWYLHGVFA